MGPGVVHGGMDGGSCREGDASGVDEDGGWGRWGGVGEGDVGGGVETGG